MPFIHFNIQIIREKLIYIALITLSATSVFVLFSSLSQTINLGFQPFMLLHVAECIIILIITIFHRHFSSFFCFIIICGIFFISGIYGLYSIGFCSNGTSLIVIFIIFASLIYRKKGGLIAIGISSISVLIIALLVYSKQHNYTPEQGLLNNLTSLWIAEAINISAMTFFLVLILDKIFLYITTCINKLKKQSQKILEHSSLLNKETLERKKIENDLIFTKQKYIELSNLSNEEKILLGKKIQEAEESEREKIAMDLHDGLGQHLIGLKYLQTNLINTIKKGNKSLLKPALEIKNQIDTAIKITRSISNKYLFFHIQNKGFLENINNMLNSITDIYNIKFSFVVRTDFKEKTYAIDLYYIMKELIINAIKHGNCNIIDIILKEDNDGITISIHDNGARKYQLQKSNDGLGLKIIQFRLKKINGTMKHHYKKNKGNITTIKIYDRV